MSAWRKWLTHALCVWLFLLAGPADAALGLYGAAGGAAATGGAQIISRGLPVFTSSGTAANATSSNYNNIWTSGASTATIAIDISTVPTAQKTTNALYWYDESGTDTTTLYFDVGTATGGGGVQNNQPTAYTIECNTGAGGGSAPSSGWSTLLTISNGYASRKHVLSGASSLASCNWVRMNISASTGAISLKLDLFDISAGTRDAYFAGDSRTWFGQDHRNQHGGSISGTAIMDQMQSTLGFYAPTLNLGMSGAKAHDIATRIGTWLTTLGAPYTLVLNIGVNDALASPVSGGFSTDVQSIVTTAVADGVHQIVIETIGYSTSGTGISNIPGYNTALAAIISANPSTCRAGYDQYSFYQANQSLISGDQVHATDQGFTTQDVNESSLYETIF